MADAHDSKSCLARGEGSSPSSGTVESKTKLLIIVGPTASGKSALAIRLARRFNGEIISADSRQVYRGLNIGTGKVTKREMAGIPHHLLDVASPKRRFTAGDFLKLADAAVQEIAARGKLPIVAGGTGFYIDALVGRMHVPNVPPDTALRKKLGKKTAAELFAMLKKNDPRRARAMNTPSERNNKVRIIRALEIAKGATSSPLSSQEDSSRYDATWIGIRSDMKALEKKIRARLLARMRSGMVAEAKRLHEGGLSYKRMEELGLEYRSLARHLLGKISREDLIAELTRDIRRYAKNQLAYWKRNPEIKWQKSTARSITVIRAVYGGR